MLKYVSIELIKRRDVDGSKLVDPEVICGFFKGIKVAVDTETHKTTSHIIIEVDGNDVRMLSLDHHYILSVERADASRRWISYPKTSPFDQTTIFEALATILAEYAEGGWCTADADIIDTSKYKNLPKRLLSSERKPPILKSKLKASVSPLNPKTKVVAKATVGTPPLSPISPPGRQVPRMPGTTVTTATKTYTIPKPSPTFFKRKGRRPSPKAMETMLGKVIASDEDDYESLIPEVEGEHDPLPKEAFEHKSARWSQGYYNNLGY